MPFKAFKNSNLAELVDDLKLNVEHHEMFRLAFYRVLPKPKAMNLKKSYKPSEDSPGLYTQYLSNVQKDEKGKKHAREKLRLNGFKSEQYENRDASLKLHVSLNQIGELDEKIIQDLMKFLINESESSDNNLYFYFKIIKTSKSSDARYANNDQITIYFDEYSSAADMARLPGKIEVFLKSKKVKPPKGLGENDSFGFNSFVSARFDNNKLLNEYAVYPFFDMELKKFFSRHPANELENIPICAFEVVFNKVIMSKEITVLPKEKGQELSKTDSERVQAEFDKMKKNPREYIVGATPSLASEPLTQNKQNPLSDVDPALRTPQLQAAVFGMEDTRLKEEQAQNFDNLERIIHQQTAPSETNESLQKLCGDILAGQNKAFYGQRANVGVQKPRPENIKPSPEEQKNNNLKLIKERAPTFYYSIQKIHEKGIQLKVKNPDKAAASEKLYNELIDQYMLYNETNDYARFKSRCVTEIGNAKHTLEIHSGWKEVFINVLAIISTLGGSAAYQYYKQKNAFFKVNTDSMNIVEGIEESIDNLGPKKNS